jgi:hypothetical protein
MYYRMIAFLKGLRRRLLFKLFEGRIIHKSYSARDKVGNWSGWCELNDECIAFRDKYGYFKFDW